MQGCATGVNPGQQAPPVIQCHRLSQWYASGGKPLLPPFDRLYVCIASGEQRATQGCDPDGTEVTPVHERERPVEDYGPLLFLSNRVY